MSKLDLDKVLVKLAKAEDINVRYNIARNPNTPAKVLAELAKDENSIIRGTAAGNS